MFSRRYLPSHNFLSTRVSNLHSKADRRLPAPLTAARSAATATNHSLRFPSDDQQSFRRGNGENSSSRQNPVIPDRSSRAPRHRNPPVERFAAPRVPCVDRERAEHAKPSHGLTAPAQNVYQNCYRLTSNQLAVLRPQPCAVNLDDEPPAAAYELRDEAPSSTTAPLAAPSPIIVPIRPRRAAVYRNREPGPAASSVASSADQGALSSGHLFAASTCIKQPAAAPTADR